jgi:hypothetical protein
LKLLKCDMVMAMCGFESRQEMWSYKAQLTSHTSGMAEYAVRKSDFYRKMKDSIVKKCDVHVKVSNHQAVQYHAEATISPQNRMQL